MSTSSAAAGAQVDADSMSNASADLPIFMVAPSELAQVGRIDDDGYP
jgi:hypothetical protein